MGYLICDKCKGYYELQPGESPEDFDLTGKCGGSLHHDTIQDNGIIITFYYAFFKLPILYEWWNNLSCWMSIIYLFKI